MTQFRMRNLEESIVYEDCDMIVINKPAGMAVQSARFGQMDLESAVKIIYLRKQSAGLQEFLIWGSFIVWISRWKVW